MLLRNTFVHYDTTKTLINDLQAVNLTSVVGAKGGSDVSVSACIFDVSLSDGV